LADINVLTNGTLNRTSRPVVFHFSPSGFGLEKPATWTGQRNAPGEIQMSRSAVIESIRRMEHGLAEYDSLIDQIEDAALSLQAEFSLNAEQITIREDQVNRIQELNDEINHLRRDAAEIRNGADLIHSFILFGAEQMPKVVG